MTERKEEEQEIEHLFEKISKENFPKKLSFGEGNRHASPGSSESQTSWTHWTQRGPHQDTS